MNYFFNTLSLITMKGMSGIIKKKGRHAIQRYKDREFIIDENGVFKYGPPGIQSKWTKKIKLAEIVDIKPEICNDPRHCFILQKKDGRILYFAAENDEEKWKWINGFREAVMINESPDWSPTNEVISYSSRQTFVALQKLSKVTMTGIWRWRYFYINDTKAMYYSDSMLSEELGCFMLQDVRKVNYLKNKHGKELYLEVQVKIPEKRSYFFAHPSEQELQRFYDIVSVKRKKSRKNKIIRQWK
ncbi:PH domain containing protein [Tritrichomonas foetus]|uniref:PH domain containing protein n=1 Tax=Tritrichomonas foetus TaxID=1144522 RepID=A0A1J4KK01_9EUKA|nr:PH domain containing protein [Tritrichomonas foetus]|eukprot:OHT11272.1 PH domain containing protein [Tritrichomonas foetus]